MIGEVLNRTKPAPDRFSLPLKQSGASSTVSIFEFYNGRPSRAADEGRTQQGDAAKYGAAAVGWRVLHAVPHLNFGLARDQGLLENAEKGSRPS